MLLKLRLCDVAQPGVVGYVTLWYQSMCKVVTGLSGRLGMLQIGFRACVRW
jgi:hypothetical protein